MTDRFTFKTSRYKAGDLRVLNFSGHERISDTFLYELMLTSRQADIDLDSLVGQNAQLGLGGSSSRTVCGVIESATQLGTIQASDESVYSVTIVPTLALLKHSLNSWVFQNRSIIDIVRDVLSAARLPSDYLRMAARESRYTARNFCVQYQESDYHFICRLLEEEGLYFWFEARDGRDVFVIGDEPNSAAAVPNAFEQRYQPHHVQAFDADNEGITELVATSRVHSGGILMRDYRFTHPDLKGLEVSVRGENFTNYQRFIFPGEYVDPEIGHRLATVRLQEQAWGRHVYRGKATTAGLLPGFKIKVQNHPRAALNQEYLVVSCRVGGENSTREHPAHFEISELECIPATVPFRPRRTTPRPCIPGVQNATVVGPAGEEIHCDKYGRVQVRFHWDRRDDHKNDSSCYIRVSQPWGGGNWGGMFIPRIGQEVLVQFLEGDPDRPVIVGRVYNGDQSVPYDLPEHKTVSTIKSSSSVGGSGFNELRFEDKASSEEIYVHAQRNFKKEILKDSETTIGGEHSETIDGNSQLKIKKNWTIHVDGDRETTIDGNDRLAVKKNQSTTVDGNRDVTIKGTDELSIEKDRTVTINGNVSETISGRRDESVTKDSSHSTDSNLNAHAAKNISVTADADIRVDGKNITITGGQSITLSVGSSKIRITDSGIEVSGSKIRIDGKNTTIN